MRLSTILKWMLAGSVLAGFILWPTAWMLPQLALHGEFLIGGSFLIAGFSLCGLVCALVLERGRLRWLMWSGLGASAISVIGWLGLMWFESSLDWRETETWAQTVGPFTVHAVLCLILGAVMMNRMTLPLGQFVRAVTIISACLLALGLVMAMWSIESFGGGEGALRLFGCLGVVTIFGTLTTLILARIKQLTTGDESLEDIVRMNFRVWCPRCGLEQQIETGGDACAQCGLSIRVTVP